MFFCSNAFQKYAKTPPIWRFFRFDKNATITSVASCNNNNNKRNNKKQQEDHARKCDQKLCGRMVIQAAVWQEHHTVLCTCARAQGICTTPPTPTLLYIALVASPVCEALQYSALYLRAYTVNVHACVLYNIISVKFWHITHHFVGIPLRGWTCDFFEALEQTIG